MTRFRAKIAMLQRVAKKSQPRRGAIAALSAVVMVVMLGFVALAVDVGAIMHCRTQLQSAADGAAYAAAQSLGPNSSVFSVNSAAREVAMMNAYGANANASGTLLADSDVVIGKWDKTARILTPDTPAYANAVQVTVRRSASNGSALPLLFAPVLGSNTADISATATAYLKSSSDCFDVGVIAGNKLQIGANCTFDNVCSYGRLRVEIGSGGKFLNGSKVGSLPTSVIQYSGCQGLPENLFRGDKQPTLANNVSSLITDIEYGRNLPPLITSVKVLSSWPPVGGVKPNTAYVVNGAVNTVENGTWNLKNNIIACRGTIHFGQNSTINNTGVAANGDLATALLATGDIQMGQQASVTGCDLIAGYDVQLNQGLRALSVGIIQAGHDIQLGSGPVVTQYKSGLSVGASKVTLTLVQ